MNTDNSILRNWQYYCTSLGYIHGKRTYKTFLENNDCACNNWKVMIAKRISEALI